MNKIIKGYVVMTDEEMNALEKGMDFSLKTFSKINEEESEESEEDIKLNCFYGAFNKDSIAGVFESSLVVHTDEEELQAFLLIVGGQSLLFCPDDKDAFKEWF